MKKADSKKEHFRNEWKYLISTSEIGRASCRERV